MNFQKPTGPEDFVDGVLFVLSILVLVKNRNFSLVRVYNRGVVTTGILRVTGDAFLQQPCDELFPVLGRSLILRYKELRWRWRI